MRSKVVRTLAVALVLCGVSMGFAQQQTKKVRVEEEEQAVPRAKQQAQKVRVAEEEEALRAKQKAQPAKSKLEEMLAEALKNNPDIRVAAAKLAEAEAELNRARVQVTQKIVALHAAMARQKAEIAYRQKEYERYKGLLADRAIDVKLLEEVQDKLTMAKAQLEELEAQLPGLLGKSAHSEVSGGAVRTSARLALELLRQRQEISDLDLVNSHRAMGPMAERLRKALQTPIKVDYKDMTFEAILKDLSKKVEGLSFRIRNQSGRKINLRFEETLPVSTILQALSDETQILFYVREYGILVTVKENVPPGAMTVEEFLRQKPDRNEHKEAKHFISEVWPTLGFARLEENIPTAQKAYQTCMDVGDRESVRALLGMTLGHLNRLQKRLSELHPELVIDDEKEAQQLKKVGEKLGKLGVDIQNWLKNWER